MEPHTHVSSLYTNPKQGTPPQAFKHVKGHGMSWVKGPKVRTTKNPRELVGQPKKQARCLDISGQKTRLASTCIENKRREGPCCWAFSINWFGSLAPSKETHVSQLRLQFQNRGGVCPSKSDDPPYSQTVDSSGVNISPQTGCP